MDYFNNDGSWETFCLNGMICSSLVIKDIFRNKPKPNLNLKSLVSNYTHYGEHDIEILKDDIVAVELTPPPHDLLPNYQSYPDINQWIPKSLLSSGIATPPTLVSDGLSCYYIYSGAKHIVIKSEDDKLFNDDLNLEKILKKIRYNKLFLPSGVNVNIYRCKGHNAIQVKTYEKGIEAMMSSCSSGSYACAYHYFHCYGKPSKIKIFNDGGTSEVIFKKENGRHLFLSKGEIEYKGELDI